MPVRRWISTALLLATLGYCSVLNAQITLMQTGTSYSKSIGDDADLQFGLLFPASRFLVQNGTILDRLTGLMWLLDSQCLKPSSKWSEAQQRIKELNAGSLSNCQGYTAGQHKDWRMPGLNELETLMHADRRGPGNNGLGFYGFNAQSPGLWSSTSNHNDPSRAWTWRTNDHQLRGDQLKEQGNSSYGVLAVRGPVAGTFPVVPIQSGQTLCYGPAFTPVDCNGTGQDGEILFGADIDLHKRFTVTKTAIKNTELITDSLTGLTFLVSAPCLPSASWANALTTIASLNNGTHATCKLPVVVNSAWRLPNSRELRTLLHYGQKSALVAPFPASISGDLTQNYWTSTVVKVGDTERHYFLDFLDGELLMTTNAAQLLKVVAVRGGMQQSLTVDPDSHKFGSVIVGQSSAAVMITVKSTGPNPLQLGQIRLIQGQQHYSITSDNCSLTTPPDSGCTISVVFSPKNTGVLPGRLEITDRLSVALGGTGQGPTLTVGGGPFFWLLSNPLVTKVVTVTAGGTGQLVISKLSIGGTNEMDFHIDSENCTAGPLNPGASCQISLSFLPTAGGERIGSLLIESNAPDSPNTNVSLVTLDTAAFIVATPQPLDYGKRNVGELATRTLTISNKGTAGPLKLTAAEITGPGSADYAVTGGTCKNAELAVDESCTLLISFTPTIGARRQATLTISSNDPARPKIEVALDGIGIDVQVEPSPDQDDGDQQQDSSQDVVADLSDDQSSPDQSDLGLDDQSNSDLSSPDLDDALTTNDLGDDSQPVPDAAPDATLPDASSDTAAPDGNQSDALATDTPTSPDTNGPAVDLGSPTADTAPGNDSDPNTDTGGTLTLTKGGGGCNQPGTPADVPTSMALLLLLALAWKRRLRADNAGERSPH